MLALSRLQEWRDSGKEEAPPSSFSLWARCLRSLGLSVPYFRRLQRITSQRGAQPMRWRCCSASVVLAAVVLACSTAPAVLGQGTREDYERAQQFLPGNLRRHIYVADVTPHWIAKSDRFWYRKAGPKGTEFLLVDPTQAATKPAFDQARLAAALSREAKHDYKSTELPFDSFEFTEDEQSIHFEIEAVAWTCNLDSYDCKRSEGGAGQYEDVSPNKQWIVFVKDYNLF